MRGSWMLATLVLGQGAIAAPPVATAACDEPERPTGEGAAGGREPREGDGATDGASEPRTVSLIFRGSEPDRWNFDAGGGWSEDDGLYGRLALHTTNLFGRGEVFRATVEAGDEHELYELEFRRPFLFGRRQSLGIRLFKDASDHPVAGRADFGQRRAGGVLTYGRRFGAFQSFELEYRYADVAERESTTGPDGLRLDRRSDYADSSLRSTWLLDRLDERQASPWRGLRLAASAELAGGPLGGDADRLETLAGLTWFRPVTGRPLRSTFGLRARLGWMDPGDDLFAQQRFYLGGEDSVRGFRRRSIAALEGDGRVARDAGGVPLGGDRLAQLNLEYHLLLGERVRLVFFADAGGVFAPGRSLDVGQLRSSAGAELRVTLPKVPVPLRLIYARNLDALPDDRFQDLSVSVGVSF